jgi:hypothetical protein
VGADAVGLGSQPDQTMTRHATAADFANWETKAATMTDAELLWSARDCHSAAVRMRGFDPIAEGRYDDEGFTYGDELRRRRQGL